MSASSNRFDAAYYERFYADPLTCSVTDDEVDRQIAFVSAYLKHIALRVRRILDLGCGLGMMQAPLMRGFPDARYQGVEFSEYLCAELGWQRGSVVNYRSKTPFDLVVCHDVIQYLDDDDADLAIRNLAALCRGALYLGVLTTEDWHENCDPTRTDDQVVLRSTAWYRERLSRHFVSAGGGVFVKSEAPVVLWSLERGV